MAAQEFNCLTPDNQMKWSYIEPVRGKVNYSDADQVVSFAKQNGMKVRGHTLIWNQRMPEWANGLQKTELEESMKTHIT